MPAGVDLKFYALKLSELDGHISERMSELPPESLCVGFPAAV